MPEKATDVTRAPAAAPPVRVLHVVDRLARGGVETWLAAVAEHIDRSRFHMDVMVHTSEPQPYDHRMRALGCRIIPCLRPAHPWRYGANFIRLTRRFGPYDVVHCHTHFWNGIVLTLARLAGIPVRLPHSRVSSDQIKGELRILRQPYRSVMRSLILTNATGGLAVSSEAGAGLYGPNWQVDERWTILRSAIDLSMFHNPPKPTGLPPRLAGSTGPVIASIARFDQQKNHLFLVHIFKAMFKARPECTFLFVGSGPGESEMRRRVAQSPIARSSVFLGERPDIPSLLSHSIDLIMLPSLFEGLPRVVLEAQAAGVPALISDSITREVLVVPEFVSWCSLAASPDEWAQRALSTFEAPRPLSPSAALARFRDSPFEICENVRSLERYYDRAVSNAR